MASRGIYSNARPSRSPFRAPNQYRSSSTGKKISFEDAFKARSSSVGMDVGRASVAGNFRMTPSKSSHKLDLSKAKVAEMKKAVALFLRERCGWENIQSRQLNTPQMKDFVSIYTSIICHVLPDFNMPKKFEDEILMHLKIFEYPHTINKSHLYTPGASHVWPHLLAYLCYMITYIQCAYENMAFEVEEEEDDPEENMRKLEYDYFLSSQFGKDLEMGIDEDCRAALSRKIWCANSQGLDKNAMIQESGQLLEEIKKLKEKPDQLKLMKESIANMQKVTDPKMENVRELTENAKKLCVDTEAMKRKLENLEICIQETQDKIASKNAMIQRQPFSAFEVRQKRKDRDGVKRRVKGLVDKIRVLEEKLSRQEREVAALEEKIYANETEYSSICVEIGLIPQAARHSDGRDLKMSIDFNSGVKPLAHLKNELTQIRGNNRRQEEEMQQQRKQWSKELEEISSMQKSERKRLAELEDKEVAIKKQNEKLKVNREYEIRAIESEIQDIIKSNEFDFQVILDEESANKNLSELKAKLERQRKENADEISKENIKLREVSDKCLEYKRIQEEKWAACLQRMSKAKEEHDKTLAEIRQKMADPKKLAERAEEIAGRYERGATAGAEAASAHRERMEEVRERVRFMDAQFKQTKDTYLK